MDLHRSPPPSPSAAASGTRVGVGREKKGWRHTDDAPRRSLVDREIIAVLPSLQKCSTTFFSTFFLFFSTRCILVFLACTFGVPMAAVSTNTM